MSIHMSIHMSTHFLHGFDILRQACPYTCLYKALASYCRHVDTHVRTHVYTKLLHPTAGPAAHCEHGARPERESSFFFFSEDADGGHCRATTDAKTVCDKRCWDVAFKLVESPRDVAVGMAGRCLVTTEPTLGPLVPPLPRTHGFDCEPSWLIIGGLVFTALSCP